MLQLDPAFSGFPTQGHKIKSGYLTLPYRGPICGRNGYITLPSWGGLTLSAKRKGRKSEVPTSPLSSHGPRNGQWLHNPYAQCGEQIRSGYFTHAVLGAHI